MTAPGDSARRWTLGAAALFGGTVASTGGAAASLLAQAVLIPEWIGWAAPVLLFGWGALFGYDTAARALRGDLLPRKRWILLLAVVSFGLGLASFAQLKHVTGLAGLLVGIIDVIALLLTVPFALGVGFGVRALLRPLVAQVAAASASGDSASVATAAWASIAVATVAKALMLPLLSTFPTAVISIAGAFFFASQANRLIPGVVLALGCGICFTPALLLADVGGSLARDQARVEGLAPCFDSDFGPRGAYAVGAMNVVGVVSAKALYRSGYGEPIDVRVTALPNAQGVLEGVTHALDNVQCKNPESGSLEDHMPFQVTLIP